MEFIKQVLSGEAGAVAQVLSLLAIVNVCLTALRSVLDAVKDKTETKIDNKISKVLNVAAGWLSKLVDWVQGNKAHK